MPFCWFRHDAAHIRLFTIRHLWWDVPGPRRDVPDLDLDSEYVISISRACDVGCWCSIYSVAYEKLGRRLQTEVSTMILILPFIYASICYFIYLLK